MSRNGFERQGVRACTRMRLGDIKGIASIVMGIFFSFSNVFFVPNWVVYALVLKRHTSGLSGKDFQLAAK